MDQLISRMPDDLRTEALKIGYQIATTNPEKPETMGTYTRNASTIRLYLESILSCSDGTPAGFERELITTYLHELGHHLGLNEEQLKARNL